MPAKGNEIFVEFIMQGAVVKVTAIESKTGTEVSIVGPANASRTALQEAAVRKLQYVLNKKTA